MLRDLATGQTYVIQYRLRDRDTTTGNVTDWSQAYEFTTPADPIAPGPISGLTWAPTGSSFIAKWTAPTLDSNGFPLRDFKDYEVTVSSGIVNKKYYTAAPTFEFTLSMNAELFGDVVATPTISVKVRDTTGNLSAAVQATASATAPPVPSTPALSVYLGQVFVTWDGNPATGVRNSYSLDHIEVHASTTTGFTPSESTLKERFDGAFPGPQTKAINGFSYGATVYVKLVSVNRIGTKSAASAQASAVPSRISGLDISDGQISTAQINFTARDIGGANAYYVTDATARDALVGVKNGDIAYLTSSGYATYRYNGTIWVSAPEIGVVAGTKILAGTLTADAVGTNLLITSSANIGTAVIDSANIANVNAAKITAGTMQSSATVSFGGGSRPAWSLDLSGNAEMNNIRIRGELVIGLSSDSSAIRAASVVKSWDYSAGTSGWSIKGDGSVEFNNGTFRGDVNGATITSGSITGATYQTATSGRRITVGVGGATGSIKFIGPDGTTSEVKSVTTSSADEIGRFGIDVPGAWEYWNGFAVSKSEALAAHSKSVSFGFGGTTSTTGFFSINFISDKNTGIGHFRQYVDENDFLSYFSTGGQWAVGEYPTSTSLGSTAVIRSQITPGSSGGVQLLARENGQVIFGNTDSSGSATAKFWFDPDNYHFQWSGTNRRLWIYLPPATASSPGIVMLNASSFGGLIKYHYPGGANPQRIEMRDWNDTNPIESWASTHVDVSSETTKEDVQTLEVDALSKLLPVRATTYRRKRGASREGGAPVRPSRETGVIAEEVPAEMQAFNENGEPYGVRLASWLTLLTVALRQIDERLKRLEGE